VSATVAIVWPCPLGVETYAAAGRAVEVPRRGCPGCGVVMGWWWGYWRWVRAGGVHRIWVRRARCGRCRVTHALLPSFCLLGRLDAVEVIGAGLERMLAGVGARPVAEELGVPHPTVRDWRRRFVVRAGVLAAGLGAFAVELGADVRVAGGGARAAVIVTLGVIWAWVARRRGPVVADRWRLAALITGGGLLGTTTSPPWAGPGGPGWMPPVPDP
jgi:ribosomal protein S27AE